MQLIIDLLAILQTTDPTETIGAITSTIKTTGTSSDVLYVPRGIELIAVGVAAVAGAIRGCREDLDLVGVTVLAIVTGLGGGLLRDIILPTYDIYMLENSIVILVCILAAVLVFYFEKIIASLKGPMNAADIVSVGMFAFIGAEKALLFEYTVLPCILIGSITALGGGMLRDIMLGQTPQIFKQGNFYGIAGIAGATSYMALLELGFAKFFAGAVCIGVTVILRVLSLHFNWHSSGPHDYSNHIIKLLKKLMKSNKTTVVTPSDKEALDDLIDQVNDENQDNPDVVFVVMDQDSEISEENDLKSDKPHEE